jgi:hypothetical protein
MYYAVNQKEKIISQLKFYSHSENWRSFENGFGRFLKKRVNAKG